MLLESNVQFWGGDATLRFEENSVAIWRIEDIEVPSSLGYVYFHVQVSTVVFLQCVRGVLKNVKFYLIRSYNSAGIISDITRV